MLTGSSTANAERLDRTNAALAGFVFLVSFIGYAMTVQRTLSFWDCGEFIAASYIMGVPHPPGTPLLMLLGRVFSLIPFVEDISYRINYMSVISSSFTAMFSYLLTVRLVKYFFDPDEDRRLGRYIAYIGGIVGGLLVAFSATNWANSVEAEAYGLALALSVAIVWLTVRFHEQRGTARGTRTMILALYLALVGVGVHMTVFLVVPICAIFFILKKDAGKKEYVIICAYGILELLMIMLFADDRGGPAVFKLMSVVLGLVMLTMVYRKIKWGILIPIISASAIMQSFSLYFTWALPGGLAALVVLALLSKRYGWQVQWRTGMAIMAVCFIGISVHLYVPLRSAHNPRIDENNPSRDYRTFINFLDRRQYGQVSMVDRMFHRRGKWENQLGRHAHMGFWSYFEEQYSRGKWTFVPFLLLGLLGMVVAMYKRLEIGVPFFTLFILVSLGLALYMNFADGTQYNFRTNDAYLEVRNRDYFFTPAFVFFGVAMGMGVSALIRLLKNSLAANNPGLQKTIVYASIILVLIPGVSFSYNFHACDRSQNHIPYNYAANILDSCPQNAILFTSGDNDTFPVWCVQEAYNYRKDVRVINLSLLNTDWYVAQMKHRYDVPISLTDEQILWHPFEVRPGVWDNRPLKTFYDRPRQRHTYLTPSAFGNGIVRVQHMMVDEIVLENKWKEAICFSSPPYAESPLKLRDRAVHHGLVYILERDPSPRMIDVEAGYDLYMNTYRFDGFANSDVYRNENATGVFLAMGVNAIRIHDELMRQGDTTRAVALLEKMLDVYPEYFQTVLILGALYEKQGDSARATELSWMLHDTLTAFFASNPENLVYLQDLGLIKSEIGRKTENRQLIDDGLDMMWRAFEANPNSGYAFRKLVTSLNQFRRYTTMQQAARLFGEYGVNRSDPLLQQLMGGSPPPGPAPPTPQR